MRTSTVLVAATVCLLVPLVSPAADPAPLLAKIKAVGTEGSGNVEAAKAWQELVKLGPGALIDTLSAFDDADPTAANWLRSAVETIADREIAASRPLPTAKLEACATDTKRNGAARRLAYDWLTRVDASAPKRLLPTMIDDPAQELRRDAVAAALQAAQTLLEKDDKEGATAALKKLLASARDRDQVDKIAEHLKKLGAPVDLAAHYGFVQRWLVAQPFDNRGGKGFAIAYPPEKGVDLNATYEGKEDAKARWQEVVTKDPYGVVDINKSLTKHMGAVAYAFTTVEAAKETPVQIRVGSKNAVKIFLNGKHLFFREEYHHGMYMDQHVGVGVLKPGRNEILLKVCQNEQKEDWAQSWSFQLRLCDAIGGAVPFKVLDEKPAETPKNKE